HSLTEMAAELPLLSVQAIQGGLLQLLIQPDHHAEQAQQESAGNGRGRPLRRRMTLHLDHSHHEANDA
ncbi:MAG TPA: hypothetical protein VMI52_03030, partial [Acetobacteraceae bacterium]|nr:hypothetical protein [Acetobacteraceae bacterium]